MREFWATFWRDPATCSCGNLATLLRRADDFKLAIVFLIYEVVKRNINIRICS
jgi:hypothetical protein